MLYWKPGFPEETRFPAGRLARLPARRAPSGAPPACCTEASARALIAAGKPVYTNGYPAGANLLTMGAMAYGLGEG